MSLWQTSFAGGAVILLTALLRLLLLGKLPKRVFPLLWLIAALRLLLPFSVQLPVNFDLGLDRVADAASAAVSFGSAADAAGSGGIPAVIALWLAGLFLSLLWFFSGRLRCMRVFRQSLPCEDEFFLGWLEACRLRRRLELRMSDRIGSPLTYGVFKPVILLPRGLEAVDHGTLSRVLLHEYAHVRRFDSLLKPLIALAACVHWFDPLAWLMYFLACRDIELACDEYVLRLSGCRRSDYALSLIEFAERRTAAAMGSGFCRNAVEERVRAVMKFKKSSASTAACAVALVAIVAAMSFFSAGRHIGDRELWSDTAAFTDVGFGSESVFPGFVRVTDDAAEVQYVLSYGSSGLDVELGLRAADGTEYAVLCDGGSGNGSFGKLPAQDYELFVRNCGYGGCESAATSGAVGIILNGGVSSWLARQFGG